MTDPLRLRLVEEVAEVRVPSGLAGPASTLLDPLRATAETDEPVVEVEARLEEGTGRVRIAGEDLWEGPPDLLLAVLEDRLYRRATEAPSHHLLLHGAVLARGGACVVLAGPTGSGKTTLATLLVRAGLTYLSDEVCAIVPGTGRLRAFPRPLNVRDPGLLEAEPGDRLVPFVHGEGEHELARLIPIPGARLAPGAEARPALFVRLDAPTREPAAPTDSLLETVPAGRGVVRLAEMAFNFHRLSRSAFDILCDLTERVPVLDLRPGPLEDRVGAVLDALP